MQQWQYQAYTEPVSTDGENVTVDRFLPQVRPEPQRRGPYAALLSACFFFAEPSTPPLDQWRPCYPDRIGLAVRLPEGAFCFVPDVAWRQYAEVPEGQPEGRQGWPGGGSELLLPPVSLTPGLDLWEPQAPAQVAGPPWFRVPSQVATFVFVGSLPATPNVSGRTSGPSISGKTPGPSVTGRNSSPSISGRSAGPSVSGRTAGPEPSGEEN